MGQLKGKYVAALKINYPPSMIIFKHKGDDKGTEIPNETPLDDLLSQNTTNLLAFTKSGTAVMI